MSSSAKGMKSAYELALERLEKDGIERPREGGLSADQQEEAAEIRRRAEAKLAEVEILFRDRRAKASPGELGDLEAEYVRERRRIEDDRDRKLARLREKG